MAKPTTSYAVGGQVAARRPGNEPVTPARAEVRGRAQAVRSSTTTAHLSGGAVVRVGSLFAGHRRARLCTISKPRSLRKLAMTTK